MNIALCTCHTQNDCTLCVYTQPQILATVYQWWLLTIRIGIIAAAVLRWHGHLAYLRRGLTYQSCMRNRKRWLLGRLRPISFLCHTWYCYTVCGTCMCNSIFLLLRFCSKLQQITFLSSRENYSCITEREGEYTQAGLQKSDQSVHVKQQTSMTCSSRQQTAAENEEEENMVGWHLTHVWWVPYCHTMCLC